MTARDEKIRAASSVLGELISEALSPLVGEGFGKLAGVRLVAIMDNGDGTYRAMTIGMATSEGVEAILDRKDLTSGETQHEEFSIPRPEKH